MSGHKRDGKGDSLYKVWLAQPEAVRVEMVADRLFLHPEQVIEHAVQMYLEGLDLYKLSQKKGKRDAKIQKRRDASD